MEKKPWPIILMAISHWLEPLFSILFYAWFWQLPIRHVFNQTFFPNPLDTLIFYFAFPIAGMAIFFVRRWSLPVVAVAQGLAIFTHIQSHATAPSHFPLFLMVLFSVFNIAVVAYVLLPAVRIAYMDPKMRWWESKPRYKVGWEARCRQGSTQSEAVIVNISEGGVFVTVPESTTFQTSELLTVEFSFHYFDFSLPGRIAHHSLGGGLHSYGVEFNFPSKEEKALFKRVIDGIEVLLFERRPIRETKWTSFRNWCVEALTTGKGLLPEIRKPAPKPATVTTTTPNEPTRKAG